MALMFIRQVDWAGFNVSTNTV